MRFFFVLVLGLVLAAAGAGYLWVNQPFDLAAESVDVSVEPGMSAREVAATVAQAGVAVNPVLLHAWFRLSGQSRQIRAGSYELDRLTTPTSLLQKLVRGEEALRSVTLVEGWTFRQVRDALKKAEQLKPDSQALSANDIMMQLGKPGVPAEGHFFPDTYTYSKGSSDLAVLKRAMQAMDKRLAAAWAQRDPKSPLTTPEQALVLASIVEKETGAPADRPTISAVFNNRLAIGMRLQTDPTVIYGLGDAFDGNLRKKDLLADTPWNTYTRVGLPPTPIAMPGKASLIAAVQPAPSKALYFVAKGDGSSHFSTTLDEHNRAVNKYQRGQ
ncbi:endolytic transglycosylase MltG [Rhodoferax sp. AJA081-3]|uniref:endolytic transglycosylase MltG n=1 Tax=Rhodoferax sp. AJA081-3 TaxID=2752316 RepID=UPI001AE0CD02|nr:endolytic transglycosylase MltG [Rhodoferax sp. AJA081-3]QTN28704.1 endolytic transglycosylase MltG [Rhodoferax sp. AJA081-3]